VDSDRQRNGLKPDPTRNFILRTECKNCILLSRSKNSSDFTWNHSKPELTRPGPDVLTRPTLHYCSPGFKRHLRCHVLSNEIHQLVTISEWEGMWEEAIEILPKRVMERNMKDGQSKNLYRVPPEHEARNTL
jgi:hypothetical protein